MIRYKVKINYTVYKIVALNFEQTYSATVGTFNEWGVSALVEKESFVCLEKSQSTPGAEWGREASLQITQMLNLVSGEKGRCTILDDIDFLAIYYSYISIKNSICEEIVVSLGIAYLFVIQSVEINYHS